MSQKRTRSLGWMLIAFVGAAGAFLMTRRSPLQGNSPAVSAMRRSGAATSSITLAALSSAVPSRTSATRTAAAPVRELNTAPAPKYKARDPEEWQGMLVNLSRQSLCDREEACGLAMACLEEKCGPCDRDRQCARGEVCVLEHCLMAANVGCRSRKECAPDSLCQLSGYSSDPRGNRDMLSRCRPSFGGEWQPQLEPPALVGVPSAPPAPIDYSLLMQRVEREFQASGSATRP